MGLLSLGSNVVWPPASIGGLTSQALLHAWPGHFEN